MADPSVVAVCGSRRDGSYTRLALRRALAAAAEAGAETELLDLGAIDLPLYHPDRDEQGDSAHVKRVTERADALLVGSPVYRGSYSSTFKSYHDYCGSDQYEDTVVGLLAVAGGGTYSSTLDHMRITIRNVHGVVIPHQVGIRSASSKFEGDELVDEGIADRVDRLGREIVDYARRLAD